ncbi:MAG: SGNH/GDSL hydrolase family protein [Candidatus Kryptoniota bacterium]
MKTFYSKAINVAAIALVTFLVASCGDFKKTNVVTPPSNGTLNFTTFVSLGNSLTAGYQSGALLESAQVWSYPADIAKQAGAANFVQPLMPYPGTGALMSITSLAGPSVQTGSTTIIPPTNASSYLQPYNNLGIPGAVLFDLTDTTDFVTKSVARNNPFFSLVLRNKAFGASPVAQALALKPTFMTVWIGANDVLGYATSGGTVGTGGPGTGPTDVNIFNQLYDGTMGALLAGDSTAKFAVANIPDVTGIPFFTTILPFVYGPNGEPLITSNGSHIPMIVQRHDANGNLYSGPADTLHDLILLTAIDPLHAEAGTSISNPMPDEYVLDSSEVAAVEVAINAYNSTIETFANLNSTRVVMVDAHAAFDNFAKYGYVAQGVVLTNSYISGGFFGLDGVHPTSQGYAYVANIFIQAINSHFGSNIPIVSISSAPGSIVLSKSSMSKAGLPNIHYSDLKPMLQLIQRRDF